MILHLPDGWVIDPLARTRLEHQLAAAPTIDAVLAPAEPLPPGASYRTFAEHLARQPLDTLHRVALGDDPGATARLERPTAGSGLVVVDRGAVCHDPGRVDADLRIASPLGRSPFPRRPVALFLGLDPDGVHLDQAHSWTNALVELGVEARLAVVRFPEGRHLTRPCLADRESVAVLRPSVIVTLDAVAADVADDWCRGLRYTTVVAVEPGAPDDCTLAPWDVGTGVGRHRATIRPDLTPADLARLIRRLAAGPQPEPPRHPRESSIAHPRASRAARRHPAALRSVALCSGVLDGTGRDRIDALATHLEAGGDEVHRVEGTTAGAEELRRPGLLVLRGWSARPDLLEILAARRAAGRPTVVDLSADDIAPGTGARFGLGADVAPLVQAAGSATSPSAAWCAELRAAGIAAHRLPTRHPLPADAPVDQEQGTSPTIVWAVDPRDPPSAGAALATALLSVLESHPDARLLLQGDPRAWPDRLVAHPRTDTRAGDPDVVGRVPPSLVVWCPDPVSSSAAGVPRWLAHLGAAGVPTLVPPGGPAHEIGLLPPELEVDAPDRDGAWAARLEELLSDDGWARSIAAEVRRRSRAAGAPETAAREISDLWSWALAAAAPAAEEGP